jgi:hypothetical protein
LGTTLKEVDVAYFKAVFQCQPEVIIHSGTPASWSIEVNGAELEISQLRAFGLRQIHLYITDNFIPLIPITRGHAVA